MINYNTSICENIPYSIIYTNICVFEYDIISFQFFCRLIDFCGIFPTRLTSIFNFYFCNANECYQVNFIFQVIWSRKRDRFILRYAFHSSLFDEFSKRSTWKIFQSKFRLGVCSTINKWRFTHYISVIVIFRTLKRVCIFNLLFSILKKLRSFATFSNPGIFSENNIYLFSL